MRGRALLAGALVTLLGSGCSGLRMVEPVETTPAPDSRPRVIEPQARVVEPQHRAVEPQPQVVEPRPWTVEPHNRVVEPVETTPAPEPRRSFLTVPALGLRSSPVVRYRGRPDDAPGTRVQDAGPTASPRGPRGGVGPGDVGNFIVTGHRTSHSAPFADLPSLRRGDRVRVRSGGTVLVYKVTRTRATSFRSPASLARQVAAVPGRPEAEPVEPMITLSTCATPEDHARGNYWSDRFGNPEHRIEKIGVLVAARDARRAD